MSTKPNICRHVGGSEKNGSGIWVHESWSWIIWSHRSVSSTLQLIKTGQEQQVLVLFYILFDICILRQAVLEILYTLKNTCFSVLESISMSIRLFYLNIIDHRYWVYFPRGIQRDHISYPVVSFEIHWDHWSIGHMSAKYAPQILCEVIVTVKYWIILIYLHNAAQYSSRYN